MYRGNWYGAWWAESFTILLPGVFSETKMYLFFPILSSFPHQKTKNWNTVFFAFLTVPSYSCPSLSSISPLLRICAHTVMVLSRNFFNLEHRRDQSDFAHSSMEQFFRPNLQKSSIHGLTKKEIRFFAPSWYGLDLCVKLLQRSHSQVDLARAKPKLNC